MNENEKESKIDFLPFCVRPQLIFLNPLFLCIRGTWLVHLGRPGERNCFSFSSQQTLNPRHPVMFCNRWTTTIILLTVYFGSMMSRLTLSLLRDTSTCLWLFSVTSEGNPIVRHILHQRFKQILPWLLGVWHERKKLHSILSVGERHDMREITLNSFASLDVTVKRI